MPKTALKAYHSIIDFFYILSNFNKHDKTQVFKKSAPRAHSHLNVLIIKVALNPM